MHSSHSLDENSIERLCPSAIAVLYRNMENTSWTVYNLDHVFFNWLGPL